MSQTRKLNLASVRSIMNGRVAVPTKAIGKRVRLIIQGDGTIVDVVDKAGNPVLSTAEGEEGTVLQKKIFNLKGASEIAMKNARNREFLAAGVAAEKAGDTDAAHEAFTNYLNATQLSFGVILGSKMVDKLANGVEIAATVVEITTEKGSLLTIDQSTISVVEPEVLDRMSFNVDDFLAEDEDAEEAPAPLPAAKPARKKAQA